MSSEYIHTMLEKFKKQRFHSQNESKVHKRQRNLKTQQSPAAEKLVQYTLGLDFINYS